jgi:hypothetical protein
MQQMQLWIFWAIVTHGWFAAASSRGNQEKSYQRKPCCQRRQTNISPAFSLSRKKGALIGRAAGEPHRSLKKPNQVCDPTASLHARTDGTPLKKTRRNESRTRRKVTFEKKKVSSL